MKKLMIAFVFTGLAPLSLQALEMPTVQSVKVAQSTEISEDTTEFSVQNTSFYYCAAVPGGYQRCSKRTGRCFGAVFRLLRQCEAVLRGDDD